MDTDAADAVLVLPHKSVALAFVVPALCGLRKGRGTLGPVSAGNQKPGQPKYFSRANQLNRQDLVITLAALDRLT